MSAVRAITKQRSWGENAARSVERATLLANESRTRLRLAPALSMIAIPLSPRTATRRSPLPLATIALSVLAWPARTPAQLYAGLDAAFTSRYVWRRRDRGRSYRRLAGGP